MAERGKLRIGDFRIARGETRDIRLIVSQNFIGDDITMPVRVIRATKPGPTILITAAIHGDELNGTGMIHDLMFGKPFDLQRGSLILVPVVNVTAFEQLQRYTPDRRDLNRSFPGSETGSMASRHAYIIMQTVLKAADLCIDLHSAAQGRTNFPNIRADLTNAELRRVAYAFGTELVVNSRGPVGSLRREAMRQGCPVMILEAGEPGKVEPGMLELGVRGVKNVLIEYGMVEEKMQRPIYQTRVDRTRWLRANDGGILRFHVVPGEPIRKGDAIATNFSVFGEHQNTLYSSSDGIVLGMTTRPSVRPGEPVCHIAIPSKKLRTIREALDKAGGRSLHQQVRTILATNISVSDPPDRNGET